MTREYLVHRIRLAALLAAFLLLCLYRPDLLLATWPLAFFWAGCACCPSCTIFSDDFSTDRLGSDYTTNGTVAVSGGVLTMTTAGAYAIANTAGTSGHGSVTASIKQSTSTGSGRLIGAYVDSNNYVYGELTINGASSTLKLRSRVSGSDSTVGTDVTFTASTGTFYDVRLCWNGTSISFNVWDGFANQYSAEGACSQTGNMAGMMASPAGGTATFDSFVFSRHRVDDKTCPACHLYCCGGITLPSTIYCTMTVVEDGGGNCVAPCPILTFPVAMTKTSDGNTVVFSVPGSPGPDAYCDAETTVAAAATTLACVLSTNWGVSTLPVPSGSVVVESCVPFYAAGRATMPVALYTTQNWKDYVGCVPDSDLVIDFEFTE